MPAARSAPLFCLVLLACSAGKRPESEVPGSPAATTAANATASPVSDEDFFQHVVDDVLSDSALPTAVVLLELEGNKRVTLGRHGVDPATYAAPPGSTVKPLLAFIAATEHLLPTEPVVCDGTYPGGFRCPKAHGPLGLADALETSCNVYAFGLADKLGLERVARGYARFGFGKPTGLVQPEAAGFVADPEWAKTQIDSPGKRWEIAMGAGHGPVEVTLLQLAVAHAGLTRLLFDDESPEVSDEIRAEILEGLKRGVTGERGVGRRAAVPGLEIAGKTGTAEGPRVGTDGEAPANGWFVGHIPASGPADVVAVLVVGGGSGGESAAPIAARIFRGITQ